jgi:phytoene dehydrogenase-like protein
VDEILIDHGRVHGVRLTDGSQLTATTVVSTAGAHETALHLASGRFLDEALRRRLDHWPLFQPIVLHSAGVRLALAEEPPALVLRGARPIVVGETANDALYVRIYNDEPTVAPSGHTVVQTLVGTSWDWWASRGEDYASEKQRASELLLASIDQRFPGVAAAAEVQDLATPLTFWRYARSWRGSYEGWLPTPDTWRVRAAHQLPGLEGLYLAGQWLHPGGGVPIALLSGRQVVQLLCRREDRPFLVQPSSAPTQPLEHAG